MNIMTSTSNYNIGWIDRTFHSRIVTETLLSPEHESGNITSNDYELAIRFLPGYHRYYNVLGGLISQPLVFAFRRPMGLNLKTFAALLVASLAGCSVGQVVAIRKHYNFVHSLENPAGFARALDNIQHHTSRLLPQGLVIVRQSEIDVDSTNGSVTQEAANLGSISTSETASKAVSKWEQIRAMSTRSVPTSSWDAIRQKQEKVRLSESGASVHHDRESQPSRPSDRTSEQAEFDAMLERERQIDGGDYKE